MDAATISYTICISMIVSPRALQNPTAPVPVLHSDDGFLLLFWRPSPARVGGIVDTMMRPRFTARCVCAVVAGDRSDRCGADFRTVALVVCQRTLPCRAVRHPPCRPRRIQRRAAMEYRVPGAPAIRRRSAGSGEMTCARLDRGRAVRRRKPEEADSIQPRSAHGSLHSVRAYQERVSRNIGICSTSRSTRARIFDGRCRVFGHTAWIG